MIDESNKAINKPFSVATREESSMVSSWTEFLCLQRTTESEWKLFTGGFEPIAECSDFPYDEDTGEYEIPDEINGVRVVYENDGYIFGGELDDFGVSKAVVFSDVNDSTVAEWLSANGWGHIVNIDMLKNEIQAHYI